MGSQEVLPQKPAYCWETSLGSNGGEKSDPKGTGGGRGTGFQRSLNFLTINMDEGERLGSNSLVVDTMEFAPALAASLLLCLGDDSDRLR